MDHPKLLLDLQLNIPKTLEKQTPIPIRDENTLSPDSTICYPLVTLKLSLPPYPFKGEGLGGGEKRKFLYNRGICIYHIQINESILQDRPISFVIEGKIGAQIDKETVAGAKRTKAD